MPLPYDDALQLRDRMWEISPTLCRPDTVERPSAGLAAVGLAALAQQLKGSKADAAAGPLRLPVENFYQTDVISRSSVTMAQVRLAHFRRPPCTASDAEPAVPYPSQCSRAFHDKQYKISLDPDAEQQGSAHSASPVSASA